MRMTSMSAMLRGVIPVVAAMLTAAAGGAELGETSVARWKDDRRAPLTLQFDDSMPTHVKNVLPELSKRKMVGVFYINPGGGPYASQKAAWERDFTAAGMVLANHTFTHKGAADVANCEEEITKANEVLDAIWASNGIAKPTLISFGRPGVPKGKWNVTDDELTALLAKHRCVLRPGVLFAQLHLKDGPAMIARVDKALSSGKPDHVAFHGVGGEWLSIDMPAFLQLLDYIDTKRDQLWITDPISIHKYEQERDGAKLETLEQGPTRIRVKLTTKADPAVFDAPLTLKTEVPALWPAVKVSQGSRVATVVPKAGVAMYDALPGEDPILLEPAAK